MKRIGLFYVELGQPMLRALACRCIERIRDVVSDANIIQLTHHGDRRVLPNVDDAIKINADQMGLMEARIKLFAKCDGEWLFIDPDVWMNADPFEVFERSFDVALTKRDEGARLVIKNTSELHSNMLTPGDVASQMPYNTGVMFSRSPAFWEQVLELMKPMHLNDRNWFGDQVAVKQAAQSGAFNVLELPCSVYNYSPDTPSEDVSDKIMVHYKGRRKQWMLNLAARISAQCS